jgi:hypothetical protein
VEWYGEKAVYNSIMHFNRECPHIHRHNLRALTTFSLIRAIWTVHDEITPQGLGHALSAIRTFPRTLRALHIICEEKILSIVMAATNYNYVYCQIREIFFELKTMGKILVNIEEMKIKRTDIFCFEYLNCRLFKN